MKSIKVVCMLHEQTSKPVMVVRLDRDFKGWFCSLYELKKWNHLKFQKIFLGALRDVGADRGAQKIKVVVEN